MGRNNILSWGGGRWGRVWPSLPTSCGCSLSESDRGARDRAGPSGSSLWPCGAVYGWVPGSWRRRRVPVVFGAWWKTVNSPRPVPDQSPTSPRHSPRHSPRWKITMFGLGLVFNLIKTRFDYLSWFENTFRHFCGCYFIFCEQLVIYSTQSSCTFTADIHLILIFQDFNLHMLCQQTRTIVYIIFFCF